MTADHTMLLLLLAGLLAAARAADISCQGIRYTYFEKGLDTSDIPTKPQQGELETARNILPRFLHTGQKIGSFLIELILMGKSTKAIPGL